MKAALYLRSSKDRSDVSIAAQRHELEKLAASRSLTVVKSYEDAVESGATEDRPGFIELVRAIKDASRGWSALLVYDTSRIARRRYIAQAIKHEAKKRGVQILYARLPADLDPVAELVLESVFEAMDEAHSLMSREKGLAGMAQNVRQGWRAGGRAPIGYRLEAHATGAVREGRPVTKTKLVPSELAPKVRLYLRSRCAGTPRTIALQEAGLNCPATSLIGVEWNALAYAGHTVWNRHAEQGSGTKRRPRDQWQICRDTHEALISDAEAEAILAQLETSDVGRAVAKARAARSPALLTGLLFTTEGQQWVGHGKYYRLRSKGPRGKLVLAATIDQAVIAQIRADTKSDLFVKALLDAGKRHRETTDPAAAIDARVKQLEKEKAKAAQLALTSDSTTFLQLVEERSRQIDALKREALAVRAEGSFRQHVSDMTPGQMKAMLADKDPARLLETFLERIILEPDLTCRLYYRVLPGKRRWRTVASPEVSHSWPHELERLLRIPA